jgi:uncharacterized protein (TIGR02145 family)
LKIHVKSACLMLVGILSLSLFCSKGNPVNGNTDNHEYGSLTDIDGNVYKTIQIGSQTWMAENLRTTKLNDGSSIPLVVDSTTPGYCYYDNTTNSDTIRKFGTLYNWYAVHTGKLAPAGWHVPDTTDWKTLENYLIANGYNWDGTTVGNKIAKSLAARTDWYAYTTQGTPGCDLTTNNRSGFSALPAGFWAGGFALRGNGLYWWTSTESDTSNACCRVLSFARDDLNKANQLKHYDFSVRCVKN